MKLVSSNREMILGYKNEQNNILKGTGWGTKSGTNTNHKTLHQDKIS